jgi:hypothetical protein
MKTLNFSDFTEKMVFALHIEMWFKYNVLQMNKMLLKMLQNVFKILKKAAHSIDNYHGKASSRRLVTGTGFGMTKNLCLGDLPNTRRELR